MTADLWTAVLDLPDSCDCCWWAPPRTRSALQSTKQATFAAVRRGAAVCVRMIDAFHWCWRTCEEKGPSGRRRGLQKPSNERWNVKKLNIVSTDVLCFLKFISNSCVLNVWHNIFRTIRSPLSYLITRQRWYSFKGVRPFTYNVLV